MDLFVYGTLLFPEVLTALLGRVPAHTPAVAAGWRAAALPGRPYPGLVPAAGRQVSGLLLTGLDDEERRLLDAYESDDYELTTIVLDGGRSCATYAWRHDVLPHDWRPQQFAATQLGEYARRCARWRAAYLPQPSALRRSAAVAFADRSAPTNSPVPPSRSSTSARRDAGAAPDLRRALPGSHVEQVDHPDQTAWGLSHHTRHRGS